MKIEVLFPEICNLYGDLANVRYIKESIEKGSKERVEIIETHLTDKPSFVDEYPDLIYIGTMTENSQKLVIEKLSQYKNELIKAIDDNVNFLVTGNALEVFGNEIIEDDIHVINGLGVLDIVSKRSSIDRYNSLYVGEYKDIKIVGFKSVFGYSYGPDLDNNVFKTILGYGTNPDTNLEGIEKNNFLATYLIGPLCILNPLFTKLYLKEKLNIDCAPAYEKEAIDAYEARLEEYLTPGKGWKY